MHHRPPTSDHLVSGLNHPIKTLGRGHGAAGCQAAASCHHYSDPWVSLYSTKYSRVAVYTFRTPFISTRFAVHAVQLVISTVMVNAAGLIGCPFTHFTGALRRHQDDKDIPHRGPMPGWVHRLRP